MADSALAEQPPQSSIQSKVTTTTTQNPIGAAVSQVFDTAGLLEHILWHAAVEDDCLDKSGRIRRPSRTLFVVRRVSTTFNATIEGSVKLKQMMFLAPVDIKPSSGLLKKHAPLHWLVSQLDLSPIQINEDQEEGIRDRARYPAADASVMPYVLQIAYEPDGVLEPDYNAAIMRGWAAKHNTPSACWRDIKICNARDSEAVELHLNIDYGFSRDNWYVQEWYLGKQLTLGEVFDYLFSMLQMITALSESQKCELEEREEREAPEEQGKRATELWAKYKHLTGAWVDAERKFYERQSKAMEEDGYVWPKEYLYRWADDETED